MPKTKIELIGALQKAHINKFVIRENVVKSDVNALRRDFEAFIGNGKKAVTVIIVKER